MFVLAWAQTLLYRLEHLPRTGLALAGGLVATLVWWLLDSRAARRDERERRDAMAALAALGTQAARNFADLTEQQRLELCSALFRVLEFDPHGNPGRHWDADAWDDVSDVFGHYGVAFSGADESVWIGRPKPKTDVQ